MKLDKFEPLSDDVMQDLFLVANIVPGEYFVDLGSGDGRLVAEAQRRGAVTVGYEIDETLAQQSRRDRAINVITGDFFDADMSKFDVIVACQTILPGTASLLDKLAKEMKDGARLITIGHTRHAWLPRRIVLSHRQKICVYYK